METITGKDRMYELLKNGQFGNRLRTWDTVKEWQESGYRGLLGLRYVSPSPLSGARFKYGIAASDIERYVEEWICDGAERCRILVCEAAPHAEYGTMSGEVMTSSRYMELQYSRAKLPMREALVHSPVSVKGLLAVATLREALDPSSFDDLMELFDSFPTSVVEFSCFRVSLGICQTNTLIWEVRDY